MAQEGVKVGVVATEGVVAVTDDGLGPSVDARSVAKLGVLLTGVGTGLSLASELGLSKMSVRFIWIFSCSEPVTFLLAMICSWMTPESYNSAARSALGSISLPTAEAARTAREPR